MVSLHHLFPTELNIIKNEAATGARSPSLGTFQHPGTNSKYKCTRERVPSSPEYYFSTPACLDNFSEVRGCDRVHEVLAPLLSPGLHVVASNINEIIETDPQVQLPANTVRGYGSSEIKSQITCDGYCQGGTCCHKRT